MAAQRRRGLREALRPGEEGKTNPLQHPCLENPSDGGGWPAHSPWGRTELDTADWTAHDCT